MVDELAMVQDIARQTQVANHCDLKETGTRSGVDAYDSHGNPYEIKTATRPSVSTGRDVGLHTLKDWRSRYWVIAIGRNLRGQGFVMDRLYVAHPSDLEPFFAKLENALLAKAAVRDEVVDAARGAGVSEQTLEAAKSIMDRGMTTNNPHIPGKLISQLTPLDPRTAARARRKLQVFVRKHPLP